MWGLGLGRMVLENAIATNKRMWAYGESNCDCVKKEREAETDKIGMLIFLLLALNI